MPELSREQLAAVPFDAAVYEAASSEYRDVRVLQDGTVEVPRLIRRQVKTAETSIEKRHRAHIVDLVKKADNSIELIVRVPKDVGEVSGLTLETPLRNYERSISITSGGEGRQVALAQSKILYDYSRFADVRNNTVRFAPGNYDELEVHIHAVTDVQTARLLELKQTFSAEQPAERTETKTLERRYFRVDAVYLLTEHKREEIESSVEQPYNAARVEIQTLPSGNNEILIETFRQPLTKIRIRTDSRNFRRPVVVEAGKKDAARLLKRGTLYDLSYRDLQEQNVTIEIPETRAAHLRLEISNGDSPPISIKGVDLEGHVYEAVFLAEPDADYRLYYGRTESPAPAYDTTTISRLLEEGYEPETAQLQQRRDNPDYKPSSTTNFFNSKTFFIIVVAGMVVALALALYKAGKTV